MTIAAAAIVVSIVTIGLSAIAISLERSSSRQWERAADAWKTVADIATTRAAINAESAQTRWPTYNHDHHHTTQDPTPSQGHVTTYRPGQDWRYSCGTTGHGYQELVAHDTQVITRATKRGHQRPSSPQPALEPTPTPTRPAQPILRDDSHHLVTGSPGYPTACTCGVELLPPQHTRVDPAREARAYSDHVTGRIFAAQPIPMATGGWNGR